MLLLIIFKRVKGVEESLPRSLLPPLAAAAAAPIASQTEMINETEEWKGHYKVSTPTSNVKEFYFIINVVTKNPLWTAEVKSIQTPTHPSWRLVYLLQLRRIISIQFSVCLFGWWMVYFYSFFFEISHHNLSWLLYAISIWDVPMDFRSLADRSDVTEEEEEVYDKQRE